MDLEKAKKAAEDDKKSSKLESSTKENNGEGDANKIQLIQKINENIQSEKKIAERSKKILGSDGYSDISGNKQNQNEQNFDTPEFA
jgi:hypothetical protein